MIERTWPYGTRKRIRIQHIDPCSAVPGSILVYAAHCDDEREATVMLMSQADFNAISPMPKVGQDRVMEFRPGGPTGGHWAIIDQIESENSTECRSDS